ncbi:MAG: RdgB/HAM1 family non-canonical purine NTP pyrophosphatase [Christensenellales bacterium]|jgi:XTP/dITP diphosphohydrolase
MDLIIASNNKHKVDEIKDLLKHKFDNIYSLSEKGIDIEIDETGSTFYENALIKAKAVYDITSTPVIADDSGLMVDALNGAPGVMSARYAGYPCNDFNNNRKLLNALEGKPRGAKFVSEVVLYYSPDNIVTGRGEVMGEILYEERGEGGFGYDPLFYCYELKKTFAQADFREKNSVSHRARAVMALIDKL